MAEVNYDVMNDCEDDSINTGDSANVVNSVDNAKELESNSSGFMNDEQETLPDSNKSL